jgi:hypothetical protein
MTLKKYIRLVFTCLVCSMYSKIQAECTINGLPLGTVCVGETVYLYASCSRPYSVFYWNGVLGTNTYSQQYTAPGQYTVTLFADCPDDGTCPAPPGYTTTQITFQVAELIPPVILADDNAFCEGGTVNLQIENPQLGYTYTWHSSITGNLGTGLNKSVTIDQTTSITAYASSSSCVSDPGYSTILVYNTTLTPTLETSVYRKSTIKTTGSGFGTHYWQFSEQGTSLQYPAGQKLIVHTDQAVYLRNYNASDQCFATASQPLPVVVDVVPYLAMVNLVQRSGYTLVYFQHPEDAIIEQFTDYYWVSSPSGTETNTLFTNPHKLFDQGTFYLRGKDRLTGTWGPVLSVQVTLRDDSGLNWIHTRTFDGTSNNSVVAESKIYFDDSGKLIQSQTKNIERDYILAVQDLKDRYGRVVGSVLPAPILPKEFTFNTRFLVNEQGEEYDHTNFDTPQTRHDPDPVGQQHPGTVGWYYSANNTIEPLVGKTNYPYSRNEFYEDGSGTVKQSAAPGDFHRLGLGHEVQSGIFPIINELDHYLSLRTTAISGIEHDNDLTYEGIQTVVRDENGKYGISLADKNGNTVMTARKGSSADHMLAVTNTVTVNANPAETNFQKLNYFYILHDQAIPISGSTDFTVENIISGQTQPTGQTFARHDGTWPAGFYRIILHTGTLTFSYANYYQDVAYQYYDDAGRLKTSVSPNGVKEIINNPQAGLMSLDLTTYTYNHRGWLLSMAEPDAGTTHYKYRKDGKIRFSQNAEQADHGRFSFTHYDYLGRPKESGEYKGTQHTFASVGAQVEFDNQIEYPETDVNDWVKTYYDYPDNNLADDTGLSSQDFVQEYVRLAVSYTENGNIKSWYSYDELGRVTWMVQQPKALSYDTLKRVFVSTYTYDFLGNVLTAKNTMYVNGAEIAPFYHHYEYDKDIRLEKVFTSLDGEHKKLRAKYTYYLHGPLKRIELGGDVQGIDFVYNIHGWLTQINHPDNLQDPGQDGTETNFRPDAFGMVLDYYVSALTDLFYTTMTPAPMNPSLHHNLPQWDNLQLLAYTSHLLHKTESSAWKTSIREALHFKTNDPR